MQAVKRRLGNLERRLFAWAQLTVEGRIQRSLIRYGLVLAIVAPSVLAGQSKETKECDKAAKIVAKGHPQKKEEDALATLAGCGAAGANAFAAGIAHYTTDQRARNAYRGAKRGSLRALKRQRFFSAALPLDASSFAYCFFNSAYDASE
jgi:hypothetical protein